MKEEMEHDDINKLDDINISFFKKLKISIVDFEQYHIIAADGWKKAISYLFKVVLIFSLIISGLMSYKISSITRGVCTYAQNNIPEFRIENNEFTIDAEEPVIIKNNDYVKTKIVLTNSNDSNEYIESFHNTQENIMIVTKNYIHIKTNSGEEFAYEIKNICERFEISKITKTEFIETLNNNSIVYTLFIFIFIGLFIVYFISFTIDILSLSIVGLLVSRIAGIPLKYSAVYSIATSSITLPIILNCAYIIANVFTGFTIRNFQVMYSLIAYIYLIISIVLMRSNLIRIKTKIDKIPKEDDAEGAEEK